ncbi:MULTISPECIES: flagellar biosynthesis protein FlhB [unclassified Sphingosinithalassobacter]|uniref:flagellar biosynthesis protein FlhB n=1 Tax=unclassified Sphingosinithalassobacter TaxID=2676235 RepID=UPI00165E7C05|nr:flagellar biosynthesis protein FlhB [Sphingosinithalassobacter sp. CS137]
MSEAPDKDQKTEDPTPKKLEDARKKGDTPVAPEVRHAVMFGAMLLTVAGVGAYSVQSLGTMAVRLWGSADDFRMEPAGATNFITGVIAHIATALLPVIAVLFAFALLGGLIQGRPMMAWARMKPKWSKLNPFSGVKRLLGKQALVEFGKTLAKLLLVGGVAMWIAWPAASGIDRMVGIAPHAIGGAAFDIVVAMLKPVVMLAGALALFDIVWQRRAFIEKMRMSLQEVKDEYKQSEGDPKVKGRIRSIQMQRAKQRMMANVPKASVVITNPTHYAVALQYDHGAMAAPVVVAKGVDAVALKIREIATANGIPLVENRPLARALHASAELDRPIPVEHYAAVAEVISYVLKIARGRR